MRLRQWIYNLVTRKRYDIELKRQHPSLWKAYVLDIATMIGAGIAYTTLRVPVNFTDLPIQLVGVSMFVSGLFLWFGHLFNPTVFNRSLWAAMGICGFLTASIFSRILDGYANNTSAPAIGSFFFFLFVTLQLYIQAGEPRHNPQAETLARRHFE